MTVTSDVTVTSTTTPTLTPTPTITPTPTLTLTPDLSDLPEDYNNAILDTAKVTVNEQGQVEVNGQAWFEPDGDGGWQETGWKLCDKAEMSCGWEPEHTRIKQPEYGITRSLAWPVITGVKELEEPMTLNGESVIVKFLPAAIKDMQNPDKVVEVRILTGVFDSNGDLLARVWFVSSSGSTDIEGFLSNVQRGQQIEIDLLLGFNKGRPLKGDKYHGFKVGYDLWDAQKLHLIDGQLGEQDILPVFTIYDFLNDGWKFKE